MTVSTRRRIMRGGAGSTGYRKLHRRPSFSFTGARSSQIKVNPRMTERLIQCQQQRRRRRRRALILLLALIVLTTTMVIPLTAQVNSNDEAERAHQFITGSVVQRRRLRGKRRAKGKTNNVASNTTGQAESVKAGTWGGQGVRLVVGSGGAQVEYDCAHGTLDAALRLDAQGRFDVAGTHTREGPGPIRIGIKRESRPARYTGSIDGQTMTLTVTLTDTNDTLGPFTLYYDQQGRLIKCR